MTAKQKANQARFKAVIAEAKKLRKKNPSLNQAQAVKQAWAIMYGKKRAGKKVGETHKDTKSHNVNIRVVSGIGATNKISLSQYLRLDAEQTLAQDYRVKIQPNEYKVIREDKSNWFTSYIIFVPKLNEKFLVQKKHIELYHVNDEEKAKRKSVFILSKPISAIGKIKKQKGYITGWRKGNTALIEEREGKRPGLKNVRVYRSKKGSIKKPGTFNRFAQVSGSVIKNKENRIFVGYTAQPEIIVGKIGSVTALKQLAPEIKVRINRGKKVLTNQILRTDDSVNVLRKFLTGAKVQTQEYALAMFLNNNNNVLAVYQFGMGGYTATVMDPRLLMAAALKLGAVSIILCHNHPSGSLLPSEADKSITREIVKVANFHNMRVLDHIILTKDGSFSFADAGLLR